MSAAPTVKTGLAKKLGLRPGLRVCLLAGPDDAAQAIRRAGGKSIRWSSRLGSGPYDLIFFWPRRRSGLAALFRRLQGRIRPDGAIWAVMPKKARATDQGVGFSWEELQAEGLTGDLVDNKTASITASDYGTRFVIRRELRPD